MLLGLYMRTIEQINNELDGLYQELEIVQSMSEETVRYRFNANSKKEYISILNEEIDALEDELDEVEGYLHRERNYEKTAGKPYICW